MSSIDEEGIMLEQRIQESETAEIVAMTESMEIDQPLEEMVSTKAKELLVKANDTSGYFESKGGLFRMKPWLMLRRYIKS